MNQLATAVMILLPFIVGYGLGVTTTKPKVITKVVTVREEVRVVTDTKKRIEKRPDGTVITVVERKQDKKQDTKTQDLSVSAKPLADWSVGLYTNGGNIAATVDRRIIGNLYIGVFGSYVLVNSNTTYGLGLRYQF